MIYFCDNLDFADDLFNIIIYYYRQEIETTRKECVDFMSKLKEEAAAKEMKEVMEEKEQSAKLIIDAAAANELETIR